MVVAVEGGGGDKSQSVITNRKETLQKGILVDT